MGMGGGGEMTMTPMDLYAPTGYSTDGRAIDLPPNICILTEGVEASLGLHD